MFRPTLHGLCAALVIASDVPMATVEVSPPLNFEQISYFCIDIWTVSVVN